MVNIDKHYMRPESVLNKNCQIRYHLNRLQMTHRATEFKSLGSTNLTLYTKVQKAVIQLSKEKHYTIKRTPLSQ